MGGYLEEPKAPRANISPLLHHVKTTPLKPTTPPCIIAKSQCKPTSAPASSEISAQAIPLPCIISRGQPS